MSFEEWWRVAGNSDWEVVKRFFRDCWNDAQKEERAACEKIALDRWDREREPEVKTACLEIAEQIGERQ